VLAAPQGLTPTPTLTRLAFRHSDVGTFPNHVITSSWSEAGISTAREGASGTVSARKLEPSPIRAHWLRWVSDDRVSGSYDFPISTRVARFYGRRLGAVMPVALPYPFQLGATRRIRPWRTGVSKRCNGLIVGAVSSFCKKCLCRFRDGIAGGLAWPMGARKA